MKKYELIKIELDDGSRFIVRANMIWIIILSLIVGGILFKFASWVVG